MKKSILLFAVALGMLTSCDPIKEDKDFDVTNITAEGLLNGATFSQYSDEACTTAAADGNFVKFNIPNVSSVNIYYIRDEKEITLLSGKAGGVFKFIPKRGSDPTQTVYFRYINQDGEEVVASKDFTLQVAADLDPEIECLASDAGTKKWMWDMSMNKQAWGNMAYCMGDGADFAANGANQWWGCDPDLLWDKGEGGQYGHTDKDDAKAGEGSIYAYMTFDEDGNIKTFDAQGNVLRSATYKVEGYDGTRHKVGDTPWSLGTLTTSAPAVMFPYQINGGGTTVTQFEILGLDKDQLVLVYPGSAAAGSWSEATFWRFTGKEDEDLLFKSWTWDTSVNDGQAWGNLAYCMGDGAGFALKAENQWWGCKPELLWEQGEGGQYGHTDKDDSKAGEGNSNAYMTLDDMGKITTYDASGKELRSANFEFELFGSRKLVGETPWNIGTLTTSAPAVMFPYQINGGGTTVTQFEILNLTGTSLVLVYPGSAAAGSWSEATFWRFTKKK